MKVIRWILLPVACILAWYLAAFLGLFILSFAESFCPENQMVSGFCNHPWWRRIEKSIICFSTGLAAALVVAAGFFVAPDARRVVVWVIFGIGSTVAVWMAVGISSWAECLSAIAAGLAAVLLLLRTR